MRRPTPLVLPVAAILVAVALTVAPAAGAAPAHRYDVSFTLHTQGFVVQLGHESDEDTVKLSFTRGGPKGVESVQYETKATITPRTLKARFGRLGRLDLRFRPVPASNRKGTLRDEGTFTGTIAFDGEGGYVHLHSHRAHGSLVTLPGRAQRAGIGSVLRPAAAKASDEEVELVALDRRGPDVGVFITARGLRTRKGRTLIYAGSSERREGMRILRTATAAAGQGAFEWHLAAGRARLNPPAPFTGSAVVRRRPHHAAPWTGDLRVPLLGLPAPLPLTGNGFRATLEARTPEPDE